MPQFDTLVEDIYKLFSREQAPSEENLTLFWKELKPLIIDSLSQSLDMKAELRMSSIGTPDRKLWFNFHGRQQQFTPQEKLKFLFGHILECLLLLLVREAGHEVTETQKEVTLEGVVGHTDAKIDGVLTDVKSASTFSFQKFATRMLLNEDPFGYVHQISGYAEATGADKAAFLVIDKQHGNLCVLLLDDMELENASERIKKAKEVISSETPPDYCYEPKELKNGNSILSVECRYCPHKWECWKDLRAFQYSNKVEYFTDVVAEPRVDEITKEEAECSDRQ